MRPEISVGEDLLCTASGRLERVGGQAVMTVTTDRLIIGPKKVGTNLLDSGFSDDNPELETFEVQIDNVQTLRRSGSIIKELEIETANSVVELPAFNHKSAEIVVDEIVGNSDLERSDWDEEQKEDNTSKKTKGALSSIPGIAGLIGGITGFILGFMIIMVGMLFSLTIIGVIIGVPLILIGLLILSASGYIAGGGIFASFLSVGILQENKKEEWVRK